MKKIKYSLYVLCSLPILYLAFIFGYEFFFESQNYRAYDTRPQLRRLFGQNFKRCLSYTRSSNEQYPFSGGGRISFTQMQHLKDATQKPVYVINLRTKNGLYYHNIPLEYFGFRLHDGRLSNSYVRTSGKFKNRLKAYRDKVFRYFAGLPEDAKDLNRETLLDEEGVLETMDISYHHLDIFRKNFTTQWQFVDKLVDVFETIQPETWVHFHCNAGKGRTTTAAILYDIFHHGRRDRLEDIVDQHFCQGGEDIMDTGVRPKGTWKKEYLEARKSLIETFYQYMNASDGYPHKKWTEWLAAHHIPVEFKLSEK